MDHQKIKSIYMGYHPRSNDGSVPQSRSLSDSTDVMNNFNDNQEEGRFKAELVEIAYSGFCAVAVMETKIGKVWQYI